MMDNTEAKVAEQVQELNKESAAFLAALYKLCREYLLVPGTSKGGGIAFRRAGLDIGSYGLVGYQDGWNIENLTLVYNASEHGTLKEIAELQAGGLPDGDNDQDQYEIHLMRSRELVGAREEIAALRHKLKGVEAERDKALAAGSETERVISEKITDTQVGEWESIARLYADKETPASRSGRHLAILAKAVVALLAEVRDDNTGLCLAQQVANFLPGWEEWGEEFRAWYVPQKHRWLGSHRAFGAFLVRKLRQLKQDRDAAENSAEGYKKWYQNEATIFQRLHLAVHPEADYGGAEVAEMDIMRIVHELRVSVNKGLDEKRELLLLRGRGGGVGNDGRLRQGTAVCEGERVRPHPSSQIVAQEPGTARLSIRARPEPANRFLLGVGAKSRRAQARTN